MSITPRAVKRTGIGAVVVILAALALLTLTKRQSPLSGAWIDESDPLFRVVLLVDESGKVGGSGGYLNEQRKSASFDITGQASRGAIGLRFGGSSFSGSLRDRKLTGVFYQTNLAPPVDNLRARCGHGSIRRNSGAAARSGAAATGRDRYDGAVAREAHSTPACRTSASQPVRCVI